MGMSKGIAIAGVWIGVGIASFGMGAFAIAVAGIALIATEQIVKS